MLYLQLFLSAGLFLLSTAAVWGAENSVIVLNIGLLAPSQEPEAESLRQGATLGVQQANQLPGAPARLVLRGKPGQWGTEGDEAAALALDEGVAAIIAPPNGAASHQVMQVAWRTRLPVVSLCADSSVSSSGIPWVIRIVPRSDLEAQTIFAESERLRRQSPLYHQPGAVASPSRNRWTALVPDGRAGREASRDLLAAAQALGIRLEEPLRFPPATNEWNLHLEKVLTKHPEAILLWMEPTPAGQLARTLRQAGFKGLLTGPARLDSAAFLSAAGKAAEGVIIPTIAPIGQSALSRRLREDYRRQFGGEPDWTARMAYDAALLLSDILRQSDPPFRGFPLKGQRAGASGSLSFDKDGNRLVDLTLLVCQDGQFKPLAPACPPAPIQPQSKSQL